MSKSKGHKKGQRKIDLFAKKEWYDVLAPRTFPKFKVGKTVVTKSSGRKLATDNLRGRVYEVNLADLKGTHMEEAYRKIKLQVQAIQGRTCLTNFYGMDMTPDKLRSIIRKGFSLIEGHVDAKTTDGYVLRLFCIGFTDRQRLQRRKTSYAQTSQIRAIRSNMVRVMRRFVNTNDLTSLVQKLISHEVEEAIVKAAKGEYPLQNVFVRKVKMIRRPEKIDLTRLLELHGGADAVTAMGREVERAEEAASAPAADADNDDDEEEAAADE